MQCEFEYCIFNKEYRCLFEEVEVDQYGRCKTCVLVSLEKDALNVAKRYQCDKWVAERGPILP